MTKRTSNTRCVLRAGRPTSCRSNGAAQPASKSSISAPTPTEKLMDEGGRHPNLGCACHPLPSPKCFAHRLQTDLGGLEKVKCADCPRTFERPIVPKGRPRLYCSKSCGNYASRRRVKGTTLTPVKVAMHNWQQAQRRAAPPPATFSQAVEALRGLPDLHAILSGENPDAVQSAHGHEALRRSPAEATSAPAHPAETQQKPTNLRTRPTKGEKRNRQ